MNLCTCEGSQSMTCQIPVQCIWCSEFMAMAAGLHDLCDEYNHERWSVHIQIWQSELESSKTVVYNRFKRTANRECHEKLVNMKGTQIQRGVELKMIANMRTRFLLTIHTVNLGLRDENPPRGAQLLEVTNFSNALRSSADIFFTIFQKILTVSLFAVYLPMYSVDLAKSSGSNPPVPPSDRSRLTSSGLNQFSQVIGMTCICTEAWIVFPWNVHVQKHILNCHVSTHVMLNEQIIWQQGLLHIQHAYRKANRSSYQN